MDNKFFLTCDIGTSVTKTVLYDDCFNSIMSASEENVSTYLKPCWIQQDPNQWWVSVSSQIKKITQAVDPNAILGVAVCAQMHAPILVDQMGTPLFPCLSWPDQRTVQLVDEVSVETGVKQPYFTSTAPKILWIKRSIPGILDKMYKVLLPKDFIRMKLSDTFVTDITDARGTSMYDTAHNQWERKVVDYIGLDYCTLPEVLPSEKVVGAISEQVAEKTGLITGTPIITGSADFSIGRTIEQSILQPKNILIYLGTGPGIWWMSSPDSCNRSTRDRLCILGVAGSMPQWFKNLFCQEEQAQAKMLGIDTFQLLDDEAEKVDPGSDGLIILPHLMGERAYGGRTLSLSKRLNPFARGVFYGLCMGHTRAHMFRAIREGVTYHLRLCWDQIKAANPGSMANLIVATGGGAKSRLWRQILADTFNLPVYRLKELETSTLGLACLIAVGTGKYSDLREAISHVKNPKIEHVQPISDNLTLYTKMFEKYRQLELGLEPFFQSS
jgi:xylulokinase